MKLADFFASAPNARPVNPKPVNFTAIARSAFVPGGGKNHGRQTAAKVTGAFAFIGDGAQAARFDARAALRERFKDPKTNLIPPIEDRDVDLEVLYQTFWRVVHEWDIEEKCIGPKLFETVDTVRELVELDEVNRVVGAYYAYVKEEHPEGVDQETFQVAKK